MDGTNGSILKADSIGEWANFTQEDKIIGIITFEGNVAAGATVWELNAKCFSFVYFLSFHVFFHFSLPDISYSLVLCPLFLTCPHQVSVRPPLRKGTLLMLYYINGRYGGAGRGGGGFIKLLAFSFLTRWGAGKVGIYVCPSALCFFVKLERSGISLQYYVCVRWVDSW